MKQTITNYNSHSPLEFFEKVNFIKTSTKIDNDELPWHQGSKRSTEIQKTPNVTKSFPYISKGNYNSVLNMYILLCSTSKDTHDEIEHQGVSKYIKYI